MMINETWVRTEPSGLSLETPSESHFFCTHLHPSGSWINHGVEEGPLLQEQIWVGRKGMSFYFRQDFLLTTETMFGQKGLYGKELEGNER